MANKVTIKDVYELLQKMETKMDLKYATKLEIKPLKAIVYGFTGLILIAVVSAWVANVVEAGGF